MYFRINPMKRIQIQSKKIQKKSTIRIPYINDPCSIQWFTDGTLVHINDPCFEMLILYVESYFGERALRDTPLRLVISCTTRTGSPDWLS